MFDERSHAFLEICVFEFESFFLFWGGDSEEGVREGTVDEDEEENGGDAIVFSSAGVEGRRRGGYLLGFELERLIQGVLRRSRKVINDNSYLARSGRRHQMSLLPLISQNLGYQNEE